LAAAVERGTAGEGDNSVSLLADTRRPMQFPLLASMGRYSGYSDSQEEQQPMVWLGGYALYATHVIVLVFVASVIVSAVVGMDSAWFRWLPFNNALVMQGQVWRIFTFGLVNVPSLQFVFDMLYLAWFGREVEKFFGRKKFLLLFAGIYLLPPLIFTALTPGMNVSLVGEFGALAVFVAFAALYPNVPLFLNVLAKWAAVILVGIFSLMAVAGRQWDWLMAIWIANGFALAFVRYQQGILTFPRLRLPSRQPKLRVLPDLEKKLTAAKVVKEDSMAEVDALLDKIAQSGMASLTPKERAKLDKARDDLMRRESGRR
jgi:membrane associated rhomboid family serine protease